MGHYRSRVDCKSNDSAFSHALNVNTRQVTYWVETKGKTIEEVDAIFEGEKHSSVPDVEAVRHGEKTVTEEDVAKSTAVHAVEAA